jgi:purine catabolism regulatory family protein/PucR-like helix-turn-helix protein/diguanylate cyclase with GGDEF domain
MPMRVSELLAVPSLDLRVVVGGDLERIIRWVHTTELADPTRYLQGGELILTTGVWRDAGVCSTDFVAPLCASDVAALGYGLPQPDATVPDDLVSACSDAGLPLLAVPFEVPFIAVSRAFVDRVYGQREEALRERVVRNDRLVRAAGHGGGLDGILDVLEPRLRAWMLGRGRRVIAGTAGPDDAGEVHAASAALTEPEPVSVNGWAAFPIVTVGRTEAHLVVAANGADGLAEDDRAAVDQTLPFLGLELARLEALRENERRLAAELVDLIMAGPPQAQAAGARLATFGLDGDAPLAAVVCESEDPDVGLDRLERALADAGVRGVAAVKTRELVAVVGWPGDESGLAGLAAHLHELVDEPVGVGGLSPDAAGLRTSVVEARHACRFARLRRDAGWATHHQVGSHSLLLALQDEEVLAAFRRALLRPLEEHDARRRSRLVETLDRFLSSGCRWQETAAALHVHVNTLRHRLDRVEQLTGRDLSTMEDRVDLYIALRSRP